MLCAVHAELDAVFECSQCNKGHCAGCVKKVGDRRGTVDVCAHCGSILRAPAVTITGPASLGELAKRLVSFDALTTAAGIALPATIASLPLVPKIISLLTTAALCGYYFRIIAHVGDNKPGVPPPGLDDDPADILGQLGRALLCGLVVALPVILAPFLFPDLVRGVISDLLYGRVFSSFVFLGFLCVGFLYAPAVLLAVTITQSAFAAVWPGAWLRVIFRAPGEYMKTMLLYLLIGCLWWFAGLLLSRAFGGIPFVGILLILTGTHLVLFFQAIVLGEFLRTHARILGWDE